MKNEEIKPIKSKFDYCPACKINLKFYYKLLDECNCLGVPANEPTIRAVYTEVISQSIPNLLAFEFECIRCHFKWNESTSTNLSKISKNDI